jgi:hypothetical protein
VELSHFGPETSRTPDQAQPDGARSGALRPVLWLLLVISAACNMVTSTAGVTPAVSIAFGVVALSCIVALVVHHYRHRRP